MTELREALTVALSVALHESADPDCTGEPSYFVTQEQAASLIEAVWGTPIVQNVLSEAAAPLSVAELAAALLALSEGRGYPVWIEKPDKGNPSVVTVLPDHKATAAAILAELERARGAGG